MGWRQREKGLGKLMMNTAVEQGKIAVPRIVKSLMDLQKWIARKDERKASLGGFGMLVVMIAMW